MVEFFIVFKNYFVEVLPFLAIGFFLSGLIHEFAPSHWVEKHLGGRGIRPIAKAALVGTILPICCFGSLPVAVSLYQKGARLGPVLAFLVATPATSISALLLCYTLLGAKFTVFIFFAVIAMGLIVGLIGNRLRVKPRGYVSQNRQPARDPVCGMNVESGKAINTEYNGETYYFCCPRCQQAFENGPEEYLVTQVTNITHRMRHVARYAFVDMVKELGPELLLGLALAALVASVTPVGRLVGDYLGGGFGYLFSTIFGLLVYICSTASVPLVDAFLSQGLNVGAGMTLLLVGPVTSWGTILVLRKEFGGKTLLTYLSVISALALAFGYIFSVV